MHGYCKYIDTVHQYFVWNSNKTLEVFHFETFHTAYNRFQVHEVIFPTSSSFVKTIVNVFINITSLKECFNFDVKDAKLSSNVFPGISKLFSCIYFGREIKLSSLAILTVVQRDCDFSSYFFDVYCS
jgi:hypothetical protein